MTNEEIIEAQKLIASMRDDLSLIAGSSEPKTVADMECVLYEKLTRLVETKNKLILVGPMPEIGGILVKFYDELLFNFLAHSKAKVSETTSKYAPDISASLDRIEQYLATQGPKFTPR